jgi:hypothetical protein
VDGMSAVILAEAVNKWGGKIEETVLNDKIFAYDSRFSIVNRIL